MPTLRRRRPKAAREPIYHVPPPPWTWRPLSPTGAPRVLLTNLHKPVSLPGISPLADARLDVGSRLFQVIVPSLALLFQKDSDGRWHWDLPEGFGPVYPSALYVELVDVGTKAAYRLDISSLSSYHKDAVRLTIDAFTRAQEDH